MYLYYSRARANVCEQRNSSGTKNENRTPRKTTNWITVKMGKKFVFFFNNNIDSDTNRYITQS